MKLNLCLLSDEWPKTPELTWLVTYAELSGQSLWIFFPSLSLPLLLSLFFFPVPPLGLLSSLSFEKHAGIIQLPVVILIPARIALKRGSSVVKESSKLS